MFELKPLPWEPDALEPHISADTVDVHYNKHHRGYVDKLNKALKDGDIHYDSLEDIVCDSTGGLFNVAAQAWNHEFYWRSLSPQGGGQPPSAIARLLDEQFGSVDTFREKFAECAANEFGSGWAWLMMTPDAKLAIDSSSDAQNPMTTGNVPLLTLDVWEHAYYLDYQNARADYIDAFLKHLLNWELVQERLEVARDRIAA